MSTAAQILINLAILGRKDKVKLHWPIILGALLPDVPMFIFYALEKIKNVPEDIIWNQHYYLPEWQTLFDMFSSIPIIVAGLLFCWIKKLWGWVAFTGSMLLHALFNLLILSPDPGSHLWPITSWEFQNPIKVFNPEYFDPYWNFVELGIMVVAALFVLRLQEKKAPKQKKK